MKKNNCQGYSIIISILLIGFLLVLTTTVFNLVLRELRDTRGLWNSIKAFAWAEAAQELALLKIKQKWYWVDHKISHTVNGESIILSENPYNSSLFKKNKDMFISYDLWVSTNNYTEILPGLWYSIIPLFLEQDWWSTEYVRDYSLSINSWNESNLVWNLIAWDKGIGGIGSNTTIWEWKIYNGSESIFYNKNIINFLSNSETYLILFNSWNQEIGFTLTSYQNFSKPKTQIISSAQIWGYRHNLQTDYDNTQFLNMLKYSVFSN